MLQSHSWKKSGQIALWRYTEHEGNFYGWHLTADALGRTSLIALIDALAADGAPASRVFDVSAPTERMLEVPNNRPSRSVWSAPLKLRMTLSADHTQWHFPEAVDTAELTLGSDWLLELRKGIDGIGHGVGDYSIGGRRSGSLPLWFWWQPRSA